MQRRKSCSTNLRMEAQTRVLCKRAWQAGQSEISEGIFEMPGRR